jgi:hypothetical protein
VLTSSRGLARKPTLLLLAPATVVLILIDLVPSCAGVVRARVVPDPDLLQPARLVSTLGLLTSSTGPVLAEGGTSASRQAVTSAGSAASQMASLATWPKNWSL